MDENELSNVIIRAAIEVHRELGHGFLEAAYKDALAIEFEARGIPLKREVLVTIYYKGRPLPCKSRSVRTTVRRFESCS